MNATLLEETLHLGTAKVGPLAQFFLKVFACILYSQSSLCECTCVSVSVYNMCMCLPWTMYDLCTYDLCYEYHQ